MQEVNQADDGFLERSNRVGWQWLIVDSMSFDKDEMHRNN